MGKSTISIAIFNSCLYVYQRVSTVHSFSHGIADGPGDVRDVRRDAHAQRFSGGWHDVGRASNVCRRWGVGQ